MKTKLALGFVIAILMIPVAMTSCSNADEPQLPNETAEEQYTGISNLVNILSAVTENSDRTEDDYIVYIASSDSFLTMTEREYAIYTLFTTVMPKDESSNTQASESSNWVFVGKYKNPSDLYSLGNKISKIIPPNKTFELRIEYIADGTYNVFYRITN